MSFRIIRSGTHEYNKKLSELKEEQLKLEILRWRNITHHDQENTTSLLAHYHNVQERNKNEGTSAQTAHHVCAEIKSIKANLVTVQGNMNIANLKDLIDV